MAARSPRIDKFVQVADSMRPAELAIFLKVSDATITNFCKQGLKQQEDRSIKLTDYIEYVRQQERKKCSGPIAALDAERIRKTSADATLAEMRIAEAEGRLIERNTIIRGVRAYLTTCAKLIQDIDKRLARHVPMDIRKDFLTSANLELRDILSTLEKSGEVIDGE